MSKWDKYIKYWLLIGCIMVLIQIMLGGITRLTNSGLSITEWDLIKGVLPPLNEEQWIAKFEKYKQFAAKQFNSLHKNFTLEEFKSIFYWEYFHRLWARTMGIVFIIPFIIFLIKKKLDIFLIKRLLIIVLFAMFSAIFGWIMVKSGLNDDSRTWVSAYKLSFHLFLASILYYFLINTYFQTANKYKNYNIIYQKPKLINIILIVLILQIIFGGLMAGMKAAFVFPYMFVLPKIFLAINFINPSDINISNIYDYEPSNTIKMIVQLIHRAAAGILSILIIIFTYYNYKYKSVKFLIFSLVIQYILGILTVSNCIGKIPVVLGVLHQLFAFILLAAIILLKVLNQKK